MAVIQSFRWQPLASILTILFLSAASSVAQDSSGASRYRACVNTFCAYVQGNGQNSCRDSSDCGHKACNSRGQCARVSGGGPDQCQTQSDCGHYVCDNFGLCLSVPGAGENQCASDANCRHRACVPNRGCTMVPGQGPNQCDPLDGTCEHRYCNNQGSCALVFSPGENRCANDSECGHKECSSSALCVRVPGVGTDQCAGDSDCGGRLGCNKYGICQYLPAEEVKISCAADGQDEGCSHRVCSSDGICVYKIGPGRDRCSGPDDCGHRECRNASCVIIPGRGRHRCDSIEDCGGRYVCQGSACVVVSGPGPSTCRFDEECRKVKACNSLGYCVQIEGGGTSQCQNDQDCIPVPEPVATIPAGGKIIIGVSSGASDGNIAVQLSGGGDDTIYDEDMNRAKERRSILDSLPPAFASGSSEAPITIDVFMDYECGMCKLTYRELIKPMLSTLVSKNIVRLRFHDFPMGDGARLLAQAARCSGRFNLFFPFLDTILAKQSSSPIQEPPLAMFAGTQFAEGQTLKDLSSCLEAHTTAKDIEKELSGASLLGVNGTPTFFINGKRLLGHKSFDYFTDIIQREQTHRSEKD